MQFYKIISVNKERKKAEIIIKDNDNNYFTKHVLITKDGYKLKDDSIVKFK